MSEKEKKLEVDIKKKEQELKELEARTKELASEIVDEEEKAAKNQIASKADVDELKDAVKELTKIVGENTKENIKWFRAGKM